MRRTVTEWAELLPRPSARTVFTGEPDASALKLLLHFGDFGIVHLGGRGVLPFLKRKLPLCSCFLHLAHLEVHIAEMIVNRRVFREPLDCTLQILFRLVEVAETVINPAKAVEIGAVVWLQVH